MQLNGRANTVGRMKAKIVRSARSPSLLQEVETMGHVYANLSLRNPREQDLSPLAVTALADTGALMLCIPSAVAAKLKLETAELRDVTLADGKKHRVPYVGPIEIRFENRRCFVGALVMGDEVLLGAVPMEDMDLVVAPLRGTIRPNPDSPGFAHVKVK